MKLLSNGMRVRYLFLFIGVLLFIVPASLMSAQTSLPEMDAMG